MRRKIAAANWKMNLTLGEGKTLVEGILERNPNLSDEREMILGVPMPYLKEVKDLVKNQAHIHVSAQNVANHASGAYTGETAASMLKSVDTDYVIVGHSERRGYYGDTNDILREKLELALANELKPIFCCGESLETREAGKQNDFVAQQLEESLFPFSEDGMKNVIIAYEPIWAIGTGETASPEQAQEIHAFIRSKVAEKYGRVVADNTTILYGGSCKPGNAAELFACEDVDGALVGGASLKADSFVEITNCL
ncbi:MAG TPA: triose-phosphate isomerase [Chitinophagaceae bacterium]|nr:triose-phosphate isomerase [Chitinophagaceae bacterium]